MRSTTSAIAAIFGTVCLLILSACGGGGGGAATTGTANNPYTISGKVTLANGTGVGQVAVTLSGGGTEYTDANGAYAFTHLGNGTYTVTPALAGYTFAPGNQTVTVNGNAPTASFTASPIPTYAISGKVLAANGSGLAGATVSAVSSTGVSAGSKTTDGTGSYSFTGLLSGDYTVSISHPDGYTFTPASRSVTVTDAGAGADFAVSLPATYRISGKATLSGGAGAANATVVLTTMGGTSYTTTTDATGAYAFGGMPSGYYGVSATLTGYGFVSHYVPAGGTQATWTPTVNGADVTFDMTVMPLPPGNTISFNL